MRSLIKRLLGATLCLMLMAAMLPGCSKSDEAQDTGDAAVTEEQLAEEQNADDQDTGGQQIGTDPNTGQPIESVDISALGGNGADVDISKLSSTMVYSVVYDMMVRPNEYIGKKIRISGNMSTYHDEESGETYYACLISDATACCSQGIEFVTTDEFKPEDYPKDGEPVTVLGTYDLFEDDGNQYCVLKDAVLE